MLDSETLETLWRRHPRPWCEHRNFAITEEGVALGADTLIVPAVKDAYGRTMLALDGNEQRILALLSVAHGKPVSPVVLKNFRAASRALAKGDESLALICLAHTGLFALHGWDYERNADGAAKALFMADRLLENGTDAGALLKGLGLLPEGLSPSDWCSLTKYNHNHDERGRFASAPGGGSKASVVRAGGGTVVIDHGDGTVETREGGSRAWRNNNPGNIKSGSFADRHGAIGSAGPFAVFPDEETGNAAMIALLQSPSYSNRTVDGAIERRSPPTENNTAELQRQVRNLTGLRGDTVISTLDQQSLERLGNAIRRTEGWREGKTTRQKK